MIDETRLRFLAAIAAQIPVERIAEVHLFHGIRQGGMESGVAVLALERVVAHELEAAAPAGELDAEAVPDPLNEPAADSPEESTPPAAPAAGDVEADSPYATADVNVADSGNDASDSGEAAVEQVALEQLATEQLDVEQLDADEVTDAPPSPPTPPRRFTVFTARYRHTLKGPDRGKWEVSVTEEADAPLLTVDAVVRGVQRRSGDADEIVRMSGDEVRALLVKPAPKPAYQPS